MITQCNAFKIRKLVVYCITVGLVPFVMGSPGIGKSALTRDIAEEFNLELIDMRLSQCDPTDLLGFPGINEKTRRGMYAPMETFPLEGDPLPPGKDGWLLFLDEFNSAERATQKAAYKLVLDKMVGNRKLHPRVVIVAAGNRATDNAIVEDMSTAMQSRLIHMEMVSDLDVFMDVAAKKNFNQKISDFLKFAPKNLNTFNPDQQGSAYACDRSWESVSKLLTVIPDKDPLMGVALAGAISEGVAREFTAFLRIYDQLPDIKTILASPALAPVPTQSGHLYALVGSLAHHATETNIGALMTYLKRITDVEFTVYGLRNIFAKNNSLFNTPEIQAWMAENASVYF